MSDTIQLDKDEAYNIAYGSPTDETMETKVVSLEREKYHMRQMVMLKQNGQWYGFEFFDALDKHGESEIGESYLTTYDPHRPESNNEVTLYKVNEKQNISYYYEFDNKQPEEY